MAKHQQRTPRFTKRLEATFSSGDITYRGILSDISENGLFIRTSRGFVPGTKIDIELMISNDQVSRLSGIVRRTVKTSLSTMKNGMGVQLTQKDALYTDFLKSYLGEAGIAYPDEPAIAEPEKEEPPPPEFVVITCPGCGVKNRVSKEKLLLNPKCGKCKTPLSGV